MSERLLGDDLESRDGDVPRGIDGANDGIGKAVGVVAGVARAAQVSSTGSGRQPAYPALVTLLAFSAIGTRSPVTARQWYAAGGELFVIGTLAAAAAVALGGLA